ncbi:thiamine phosphate synthase [Reichenbachiella ulvae]
MEAYPNVGLHWKSHQKVNQSASLRSKSFHSIEEINEEDAKLDYAFLSPIFNSISKQGYKAAFDVSILGEALNMKHPFPIYALGGIDWNNFKQAQEMGFAGFAMLGAFWNMNDNERRFKLLKQITHGNSKR